MDKMIEDAGPGNAPKLTPEHIASLVVDVAFHQFPGTTVTVCCVTLQNGFNTIGHSACVSPENFDQQIGEQIAYKNALNEIWQIEGYLLAEILYQQRQQAADERPRYTEPQMVGSGVPGDTYGQDRAQATSPQEFPFAPAADPSPSVSDNSGFANIDAGSGI